jgi:branched-chain amino acid transport system substrate-binding protein
MWGKLTMAAAVTVAAAISSAALAQDRTGITNDSIKIGIVGPFSGSASELGKAQIGAIAYYRSINDQGGIHGRKIVPVIEDDACDEARGIAATRKLISQDQVFALHAHSCSGVALAAKPIIVEAKIPYMVGSAVSEAISFPTVSNIYHPTPPSQYAGEAMIKFALSKPGVKRIAIVSHSNEWAKGYHDAIISRLKKDHQDIEVTDLTMERQSIDATVQVLKIRQANPDFVIVILYSTETTIFLRDAHKYALNVPMVGGYATSIDDQLKKAQNPAVVKNFHTVYLLNSEIEAPGFAKWREMVSKYYPNENLSSLNFVAIGGAISLVEALKSAGPDVSRESLIAELDKQKNLDSGVMAGPISFTKDDHVGIKDLAIAGFVDGKPTIFKSWGSPAVERR